MATDPGLALQKLAGQPLPQLPLVSSSASSPKAFLAPSLPWAHRAVWKTKNQSGHRRVMQELTHGLLLRSVLQLPLITALLLQATGGKTTTTAGLGPSPEPASRPQCYQHWGVVVFVGCHGLPKSHSGVKSPCPKFLGQK